VVGWLIGSVTAETITRDSCNVVETDFCPGLRGVAGNACAGEVVGGSIQNVAILALGGRAGILSFEMAGRTIQRCVLPDERIKTVQRAAAAGQEGDGAWSNPPFGSAPARFRDRRQAGGLAVCRRRGSHQQRTQRAHFSLEIGKNLRLFQRYPFQHRQNGLDLHDERSQAGVDCRAILGRDDHRGTNSLIEGLIECGQRGQFVLASGQRDQVSGAPFSQTNEVHRFLGGVLD